jgi:hypothetical protein
VPLRDTRALRDWAISSNPADDVWNGVVAWVAELHTAPYRAPSTPDESRSDRPNYEVRRAEPVQTVQIEYLHVYNGDLIDLLRVESR